MRWVLALLILVISCAALGLLYFKDPGAVNVIWMGFEYQNTAVVTIIAFFVFFFLLILIVNVLSWIIRIPQRLNTYYEQAKESKAEDELLSFFSAYEAEMFKDALDHQKKAALKLSKNPIFLWISGNVYTKMGDSLAAGQCFYELSKNPLASFLGLKGAIRSALHHSDFKGAFLLLERAEKLVPNSTWVLKHLLSLAREMKDYKKGEELILRLEDLGRLTSEQSKRQVAHLQYQQAIEPEMSETDRETLLRQAHLLDPSHTKTTEALAGVLAHKGQTKYALNAIEATWQVTPEQNLGDLYLELSEPKNEIEAYEIANRLVKHSEKNPIKLLFLARTALKAKLWGEARIHLTKLLNQNASACVYELLARLELEEHQDINGALKWLTLQPPEMTDDLSH